MSPASLGTAIQHSAIGTLLGHAPPSAVLAIQIAHVLGLVLLLTALLLVNLRLLGTGLRDLQVPQLARALRGALATGLVLTIGSGTLLFLTAPAAYLGNAAFVPKMVLLLFALALQWTLHRRVTLKPAGPALARTTALASLALWFGVGLAGRAIGFV